MSFFFLFNVDLNAAAMVQEHLLQVYADIRKQKKQLLSLLLVRLAVTEPYLWRPRALRQAGIDFDSRKEEELDFLTS